MLVQAAACLRWEDVQLTATAATPASPSPGLLLTGQPVTLGVAATPMTLSALLARRGYTLHASGGGTVAALQAALTAFRLPAFPQLSSMPQAPAAAQLSLSTSGPWLTADQPGTEAATDDTGAVASLVANLAGTVHLQNVRWEAAWLPAPIEAASADATLTPGMIHLSTTAATIGSLPAQVRFSGTSQLPTFCSPPAVCVSQFALGTSGLDAKTLQTALGGNHQPLLSALLSRLDTSRIRLPLMTGSIHADTFTLGRLPMRDVSLQLSTLPADAIGPIDSKSPVNGPTVTVHNFAGHTLGGSLQLQGTFSLVSGSPHYALAFVLAGASAAQAGALWHETWGPGTFGATADLALTGSTAAELLSQAKGSFQASWLQGGLRSAHGSLPPALAHFSSWDGSGVVDGDGLTIKHGALSGTPAMLDGTIGWDRTLGLHLQPALGGPPVTVDGTLAAPGRYKCRRCTNPVDELLDKPLVGADLNFRNAAIVDIHLGRLTQQQGCAATACPAPAPGPVRSRCWSQSARSPGHQPPRSLSSRSSRQPAIGRPPRSCLRRHWRW